MKEKLSKKEEKKNALIVGTIRSYGCCVCGTKYRTHIHHVRTRGAIGKIDENNVVPLCYVHDSHVHTLGRDTFAKKYSIDLPSLAIILWRKASENHGEI